MCIGSRVRHRYHTVQTVEHTHGYLVRKRRKRRSFTDLTVKTGRHRSRSPPDTHLCTCTEYKYAYRVQMLCELRRPEVTGLIPGSLVSHFNQWFTNLWAKHKRLFYFPQKYSFFKSNLWPSRLCPCLRLGDDETLSSHNEVNKCGQQNIFIIYFDKLVDVLNLLWYWTKDTLSQ